MKKIGSISDFKTLRDKELLARFREELAESRGVPLRDLFGRAARRPASRFWVSELRAAEVVSKMLKGEETSNPVPQKARMYDEICRRVIEWQEKNPGRPLSDAVFEAVNSTAPEFYLTDQSARVIIYRLIKKRRERNTDNHD